MQGNRKPVFVLCVVVAALLTSFYFRASAQATPPPEKRQAFVPGRLLVRFRAGVPSARARGILSAFGSRSAEEFVALGVHVVALPENANEEAVAEAFKLQSEVEFAELDRLLPVQQMTPNDYWYPDQWALRKISAPTAWASTTGNSGVTIAILDTGIDGTHEDLASKLVSGWNIYDNNADTSDVHGHGTKVAGTAAAASNNSVGVVGVTWNCALMPVRVSATDGTASDSAIASGLTWAADHGARVANVSYKVSGSSTVTTAARYFQNKGGVVSVAAGNYSTFEPSADNPYVLTVSATDPNDALYSWSNTGNNIDLAAPGTVTTTIRGGGYNVAAGTSVAAPIVAGVAALILSANPALTGQQAQDILKQSADDRGTAGWDAVYGAGRINAARAVALALGGGGGGNADLAAPTVSFSAPVTGATVTGNVPLQISVSDNVGVVSVNMKVDGVAWATATAAPYSFTWNSTSVANGTHTLTATASDAAGNAAIATISVTVNNSAPDTIAPTILITSPTNNAKVSGNVAIVVSATDNIGVMKVELYLDGKLKASTTTAPFTVKWNTQREAMGVHSLLTKAYDAAGNMGSSAAITVYK